MCTFATPHHCSTHHVPPHPPTDTIPAPPPSTKIRFCNQRTPPPTPNSPLTALVSANNARSHTHIATHRSMHRAVQLTKVATPIKALRHAYRQEMLAFARARRDRNPLTVEGYAFTNPADAVAPSGPHADPPAKVLYFVERSRSSSSRDWRQNRWKQTRSGGPACPIPRMHSCEIYMDVTLTHKRR